MSLAELTGDEGSDKSKTFIFTGEDHTLGNALQGIISKYPETNFCGYTIPHPAENKINFRIQTCGPKAIDLLRRGLTDLEQYCASISQAFEQALLNYDTVKEDATISSS